MKKEITWGSSHAGVNITLVIENGELQRATHWGTSSAYTHNLPENPHWEHAKGCLDSLYADNQTKFFDVVRMLIKDSKGYQLAMQIKDEQIYSLRKQLNDEMDKWKNI